MKAEEESQAGFSKRSFLPLQSTQLGAPDMFPQTFVGGGFQGPLTKENTKGPKQPSHGVILKQQISMLHIYSYTHTHPKKRYFVFGPIKKEIPQRAEPDVFL